MFKNILNNKILLIWGVFIVIDDDSNNLNTIDSQSINLLFVASDNDKTSGAFISMVTLVDILRNKYGINVFVILPHKGDGVELLNDKKIPFKIIYSFTWVIPISVKDNKINKITRFIKRIINIKPIIEI